MFENPDSVMDFSLQEAQQMPTAAFFILVTVAICLEGLTAILPSCADSSARSDNQCNVQELPSNTIQESAETDTDNVVATANNMLLNGI